MAVAAWLGVGLLGFSVRVQPARAPAVPAGFRGAGQKRPRQWSGTRSIVIGTPEQLSL
jgi:hypothetical protein